METGSADPGRNVDVNANSHFHVMTKLRICRVIPPLPHIPSWHEQGKRYHSLLSSFCPRHMSERRFNLL